jgi:hypothetical protein
VLAASNAYDVEYLIVGGGAGGGTNITGFGVIYSGGGGAGGFKTGTIQLTAGMSCAVTIGPGGAIGANGGSTIVTNIATALGGGHGGRYNQATDAASGGSGGGGGGEATTGGTGTAGQGNNGANGQVGNIPGAGGGSGSAAVGTTPGTGTALSISGSSVTYANGGPVQNGTQPTEPGSGGRGGSGDGGDANPGVAGIVILRYVGAQRGTGGTISTSGTYTIHTFTSDGTFVA